MAKRVNPVACAFERDLKLARTIADLDASEAIRVHHLAEAIQCQPRMGA